MPGPNASGKGGPAHGSRRAPATARRRTRPARPTPHGVAPVAAVAARAGFRRRREQWGVLATIAFVVLLVYFVTGSVVDVVGTALALVICAPVLVLLFVDRSHK